MSGSQSSLKAREGKEGRNGAAIYITQTHSADGGWRWMEVRPAQHCGCVCWHGSLHTYKPGGWRTARSVWLAMKQWVKKTIKCVLGYKIQVPRSLSFLGSQVVFSTE